MSKNKFRYINIYYWLRKLSFSSIFQKNSFFNENLKRKIIFYLIYKSFHWRDYHKTSLNESSSGLGSDINVTKKLTNDLDDFLKTLEGQIDHTKIRVSPLGPVVASHGGPGVIGISFTLKN